MNWDDVRLFLAVARSGQILGASRRLQLNHATVARRLDQLEAALGARLLERRPNGCTLTHAGVAFLDRAERMEAEMDLAKAAVASDRVELSGTVRVGAPDGFGTDFLAPRLGPLLARHPRLKVQLVPVPRAFSLSRREADIAITVDRPEQGRLVAQKLIDYSLGLFASSAYLEAFGAPASLADLSAHRLVGYVEDLVYSASLHYADDLGAAWASRFEVSSALGQTVAVEAGAGIGILHTFMAARRPDLGRVLPDCGIGRTYWLVTHESTRGLAGVQAVARAITDLVAAERAIFR
ncbi:LysR family transcriptional regulator [Aureimonas sp. Leaf454]|uniref:LysR family transcriptional regulator n=1 Tax=Aureimonas sp. Leaf454 TaxID=1736381 RepID=UPI0009E8207A|nr:LysR family transcriptional regulator [Aureimonas sp. Leaf454]